MKRHPFLRALFCFLFAVTAAFVWTVPSLAEPETASGAQWINTDLDGAVGFFTKARLQDNFHLAVNRRWLRSASIGLGTGEASSVMDQQYEVMMRKFDLIQNCDDSSHDSRLIRKLRDLVLNWDSRDAAGVEPLRPMAESIAAIETLDDLTAFFLSREHNPFMIDPSLYSVSADLSDPSRYVVSIGAMPLTLEDSAEYVQRTAYGDLLYDVGLRSNRVVLKKLGYTQEEADRVYESALAFEAMMAEYIPTEEDTFAPDYMESLLNYYDREGLTALCGDYPMVQILDEQHMGHSDLFLVLQPAYFTALAEKYTQENLPLFKDWLLFFSTSYYSDALDRDTYLQLSAIYRDAIGIQGDPDELDIMYNTVTKYLFIPVDNLYIQTYCTEEMRQDILNLIEEVIGHYRVMLQNEDWLSRQMREKAIDKLDHMRIRAVYPDTLADWSALDFKGPEEGGTLIEAIMALNQFSVSLYESRVNQTVDKDVWDQTSIPASTVNASYNPQENSISILAGILGGEFYRPDMSYEQKLGAIGFVIGHEISHAFDTNGANFDRNGAVSNWWLPEDYAAFQARTAKLVAWYDAYVPYEGGVYSGERVKGEAIADMGGLKCMLAIAAQRESFDYDAFFRQYATLWRTKLLPNALMVTVSTGSHPLGMLRTNVTVQQFEEFYTTYDIQPGDGMYLAPEDRFAVW